MRGGGTFLRLLRRASRVEAVANFCTFPVSSVCPPGRESAGVRRWDLYLSPRSQIPPASSGPWSCPSPREEGVCLLSVCRPERGAGLAISEKGRGLFRELVTHLRSREGGARAVSRRRGWGGRLCGPRVGERFLAGLQAEGVLDLCVVAVAEGGAPVWPDRPFPPAALERLRG